MGYFNVTIIVERYSMLGAAGCWLTRSSKPAPKACSMRSTKTHSKGRNCDYWDARLRHQLHPEDSGW